MSKVERRRFLNKSMTHDCSHTHKHAYIKKNVKVYFITEIIYRIHTPTHTYQYTHTHTNIYLHMYVYMCVCVEWAVDICMYILAKFLIDLTTVINDTY